jgi:hypothetical protein
MMKDDLVEKVARAISGAPFSTQRSRSKAAKAILVVLEEAATAAESMYQDGQIGQDIAAAIRALGEKT